ncbi:hypothetical protein F0Q45_18340 [Mycobacterium simiae]|uniref:Uncharacterized protein n=1 Tax=Mycobacterium simiae TaxID=1784 RepID=A0A5B1BJM2_MYCSI|nr:hypothetical protein F0Q45_18340 [Mycobacterium simiae]
MKLHFVTRGLLAGLIGAAALVGGTGVARADPDDGDPDPLPSIIDDFATLLPSLTLDPRERGGAKHDWSGTGMYCQNQFVRCRVHGF